MRTNRTTYAVLGFLSWGPMSGYDIKKIVERSTANFWTESYGQIYPILRNFTERGLAVRVSGGTKAASGRERQAYQITERGRAELDRWLREATDPPTVRNELLLKLFFSRNVEPGVARSQVEEFRRQVTELARQGEETRSRLESNRQGSPDLPYWLLTLRFGEIQRAAVLTWCEEAVAALDRLATAPPGATKTKGDRAAAGKRRASKRKDGAKT